MRNWRLYILKSMIRILINVLMYFLSGFSIRSKNRVIFGAWDGNIYGDNSKYLFEYLLKEEDLELIWVGRDTIKEKLPTNKNVKFVRINTVKAYYYGLTAKYVFLPMAILI